MIKSVLVTGANGFVGSHIVEALLKFNNVNVIIACRNRKNIPLGFTGEVRVGDLRNAEFVNSLVKNVDVLCHAAAWTSLWGHSQQSNELYLQPTLALIDAARAAGVKRFINTSTTSAASPQHSADPMSHGIPRSFWPHLCNVVAIEDALRERAGLHFKIVNLRLGIFAGQRYGVGILPILTPRLKTHLVPWVANGRTSLPIVDGRDIGQAFALAVLCDDLADYESFNIVGAKIPTVREVITMLSNEFHLPRPHFSVPFAIAYPFAWLMEKLDPIMPWEPLVTRSIIHLMEEVNVNNAKSERLLGYHPTYSWQEAVRLQMQEMQSRQTSPMSMARPVL